MPTYQVTFRDGPIGPAEQPLTVRADDYGGVAQAVRQVAEEALPDPAEVVIEQREDESDCVGLVYCGFDTVAHFDIEEIP